MSGLVDSPREYDSDGLGRLGAITEDPQVVVPLRNVIEQAHPTAAATHITAVSVDGAYSASIPLSDALSKGELHLRTSGDGGTAIRLLVPDGITLCWNVKGLGRLRLTEGPEPDSLPEVLTH